MLQASYSVSLQQLLHGVVVGNGASSSLSDYFQDLGSVTDQPNRRTCAVSNTAEVTMLRMGGHKDPNQIKDARRKLLQQSPATFDMKPMLAPLRWPSLSNLTFAVDLELTLQIVQYELIRRASICCA